MARRDGATTKRRGVRLALLAAVLAGALASVGALRLVQAASSLRSADSAVDVAEVALADGRLGDAQAALRSAGADIQRANEARRTSPSLSILGALPVVDQNLAALLESVDIVAAIVHGADRVLASAAPLEAADGTLQVSLSDGSVPVDALAPALVEVRALRSALPRNAAPRLSPLVLPPVRELHERVHGAVEDRRRSLDRLDRGLTLLGDLVGADRPRRYLLAVANTAEMRGAGGMMLNFGVLEGRDGVVDLVDFGRVEELPVMLPVSPDAVGLPADYQRRWNGFAPTQEWRNATLSGDFGVVAPALEEMFRRATGRSVDGVIQVDPHALAALLAVVGPVEVPEAGTVTADDVEALVLHDAYRRFPGVERRTDVLGDVAEATFRRLVDGDFPSIADLADAVVRAVDGRHVQVHSSDPATQDAIRWFGGSGELPPRDVLDNLQVTVQNMAGNKLDWYLDTAVSVEGARPASAVGHLRIGLTITNHAPPGVTAPRYIFGPLDATQSPGLYRGAVSVYLPTGTTLVESGGGPFRLAPSMQTEEGRPVVSAWVDVPAGESRTIELDLDLAPVGERRPYELVLVPQPRVRPTTASVAVVGPDGPVVAEVVLDRTWVLGSGAPVSPSAASAPGRAWHDL